MENILDPWAKPLRVRNGGQTLFLSMYGGTRNDNLITKRFILRTCAFHKY